MISREVFLAVRRSCGVTVILLPISHSILAPSNTKYCKILSIQTNLIMSCVCVMFANKGNSWLISIQFVLSFLQEVIYIIVCRSSLEIKCKVHFTKLSSTVCATVRKFCLLLVVSIIFVRDIKIISIFPR